MSHQIDNKGLEIIEKNQKEIMQLESTVTKMKNSLQGLNRRFDLSEESVNLKIDQLRLSSLRNRKKNE